MESLVKTIETKQDDSSVFWRNLAETLKTVASPNGGSASIPFPSLPSLTTTNDNAESNSTAAEVVSTQSGVGKKGSTTGGVEEETKKLNTSEATLPKHISFQQTTSKQEDRGNICKKLAGILNSVTSSNGRASSSPSPPLSSPTTTTINDNAEFDSTAADIESTRSGGERKRSTEDDRGGPNEETLLNQPSSQQHGRLEAIGKAESSIAEAESTLSAVKRKRSTQDVEEEPNMSSKKLKTIDKNLLKEHQGKLEAIEKEPRKTTTTERKNNGNEKLAEAESTAESITTAVKAECRSRRRRSTESDECESKMSLKNHEELLKEQQETKRYLQRLVEIEEERLQIEKVNLQEERKFRYELTKMKAQKLSLLIQKIEYQQSRLDTYVVK